MTRILFACVGNSCRSQMAEAFCREEGHNVECASAGSHPASRVQPDTITAMSEVGIDISSARPKPFNEVLTSKWDYLVTMGCEVDCPLVPGAKVIGWQIPDPYGKGIEEYRRVRDLIHRQVRELLDSLDLLHHDPHDDHQPVV